MNKDALLRRIQAAVDKGHTALDLSRSNLTSLPPEIGKLTKLTRLYLYDNQLTSLPPEIGKLTSLAIFRFEDNQLTSLPPEIGKLTSLIGLFLDNNHLTSLPPEIGKLTRLRKLRLGGNELTSLPPQIGELASLTELHLYSNHLSSLRSEIGKLAGLETLGLEGNTLPDALMVAYGRGMDDLRTYLWGLEEHARKLFEAKLVLVGEGGVGKTCLLAAMLGEEFDDDEETTYGIEIRGLEVPHPEIDGQGIRLNAWDFGGQRVYRITHQFFFSRRSLYLLLWSPRMDVEQCDVEGWLKMIRLRVGAGARVIIVATHAKSDEHVPRINESAFRRDFGEMIVGFHQVDSREPDPDHPGEKYGVAQLKEAIARAAADLPQMGEPFPAKWEDARQEVMGLRDEKPQISLHRFTEICKGHDLDKPSRETLADLMHDLGHVVYYGDDEGLCKEMILRPEWLSKAIAAVLEDPTTNREKGVLDHARLREIWYKHTSANRPVYTPSLHPYLLRLMEKHDVAYRLQDEDASLVGQLVPSAKPVLPWEEVDAAEEGESQISLVCPLDDVPEGLVARATVRAHRFWTPHSLHWKEGVFLEHDTHGTALMELRGRELLIAVRANWPNHFMDVLRDTVDRLITTTWPGQGRVTFAVPCPGHSESGEPCKGRFSVEALQRFRAEGDLTYRCQQCMQKQNIDKLLIGFDSPDLEFRKRLDEALALLREAKEERRDYASQAALFARRILIALATETRECPRMFTLLPEDVSRWNPANVGMTGYRLTLWCEMPGCEHPVCAIGSDRPGEYKFKRAKDWLVKVAPYAALVARTLRTVVPIAGGALKAVLDESLLKEIGPKLDLMEKVVGGELLKGELDVRSGPEDPNRLVTEAEGAGLRELHGLLRELDPKRRWGKLRRVQTPTGDYLWLCPKHYPEYDPGLVVIPPEKADD